MLSGSLCNFYTWSRNSFARPSTNVLSIVAMKYAILLNRSHTTKIALYPWASNSLVMKSAEIWLHGFSRIVLGISLLAGASLQFLYLWQVLHSSTYFSTIMPQVNFLQKITFDKLYNNGFLIGIRSRTLSISSECNTIWWIHWVGDNRPRACLETSRSN